MQKAIFLDRDGTINIEKKYLYQIEDFEFIPGVIEALQLFQKNGYMLFIMTNQSGIARGYYHEEDFLKLNRWMLKILCKKGIYIERVYYCPHHPTAAIPAYKTICHCRKPATGMYEQAQQEYDIDYSKSFAIGDKLRDCAICRNSACKGYLIGRNEKEEIILAVQMGKHKKIQYASDLLECAKIICNVLPGSELHNN